MYNLSPLSHLFKIVWVHQKVGGSESVLPKSIDPPPLLSNDFSFFSSEFPFSVWFASIHWSVCTPIPSTFWRVTTSFFFTRTEWCFRWPAFVLIFILCHIVIRDYLTFFIQDFCIPCNGTPSFPKGGGNSLVPCLNFCLHSESQESRLVGYQVRGLGKLPGPTYTQASNGEGLC